MVMVKLTCHCGQEINHTVYDRCSGKWIKSCPKCLCRYKNTGELEPHMLCGWIGLSATSEPLSR